MRRRVSGFRRVECREWRNVRACCDVRFKRCGCTFEEFWRTVWFLRADARSEYTSKIDRLIGAQERGFWSVSDRWIDQSVPRVEYRFLGDANKASKEPALRVWSRNKLFLRVSQWNVQKHELECSDMDAGMYCNKYKHAEESHGFRVRIFLPKKLVLLDASVNNPPLCPMSDRFHFRPIAFSSQANLGIFQSWRSSDVKWSHQWSYLKW